MRNLGIILLLLLAFSCGEKVVNGYIQLEDGVQRKLLGFGDGEDELRHAVYAIVGIKLSPSGLDYNRYDTDMEFDPAEYEWESERLMVQELGNLKGGDSIEWQVPYAQIKGLFCDEYAVDEVPINDSTLMRLVVSSRVVYDEESYLESPERAEKIRKMQEQEFIEREMHLLGLTDSLRFKNGIYEKVIEEGEGPKLSYGQEITLAFDGYFLNGELFDSAQDSASYLYFPYGKPDQVIRGLEIALSGMKKNGRKEVWIPSHLAFGARGSGLGIVPPNTPLKYTIHVQDVLSADSAEALRSAVQIP
ncbi:MAG: FKBP-type peptidyl-prolyl cis-trans isomerase [Flavobacteriales bacterium]|nr:FKBP-type peptidyl-prolyl cis-trans isomerase [Flavobacteriales bacterium]MDG1780924.1 FKBP-type peptidyl-prolyl cis-trans isomerase [Flavobacteriales bacterium]MDG2245976.1 FKBP-type peptidyl-prolyl cis-trans isomerase [Flavobacteriales bacterium]